MSDAGKGLVPAGDGQAQLLSQAVAVPLGPLLAPPTVAQANELEPLPTPATTGGFYLVGPAYTGAQFTSIQTAIDVAEIASGGTHIAIIVLDGRYIENVTIAGDVSLLGMGAAVIDGSIVVGDNASLRLLNVVIEPTTTNPGHASLYLSGVNAFCFLDACFVYGNAFSNVAADLAGATSAITAYDTEFIGGSAGITSVTSGDVSLYGCIVSATSGAALQGGLDVAWNSDFTGTTNAVDITSAGSIFRCNFNVTANGANAGVHVGTGGTCKVIGCFFNVLASTGAKAIKVDTPNTQVLALTWGDLTFGSGSDNSVPTTTLGAQAYHAQVDNITAT